MIKEDIIILSFRQTGAGKRQPETKGKRMC